MAYQPKTAPSTLPSADKRERLYPSFVLAVRWSILAVLTPYAASQAFSTVADLAAALWPSSMAVTILVDIALLFTLVTVVGALATLFAVIYRLTFGFLGDPGGILEPVSKCKQKRGQA